MKEARLVQDYLRDIIEVMDKAESFVDGIVSVAQKGSNAI